MNKTALILAIAMAVTFLDNVKAVGQNFSVSIVGRDQSCNWPYEYEGLPIVYYTSPGFQRPRSFIDSSNGELNAFSFFVVVQNQQNGADTISASASNWYDCLQFTITTGSGETYHVSRREQIWTRNPIVTWTFQGGGKRVIPVDFTSSDWQGLPAFADPYPQIDSITATFRYPDSIGKMVSVETDPTDVYFSSESWAGLAADPKRIEIPGFSIGQHSAAGPGMESSVFFTPPLQLSRYALTDESLENPIELAILRYPSPESAKRVFEAAGRDRQMGPEPLRIAHWDAAHRWIAYKGAADLYLLKGDYVISLFRLPLGLPDAKKNQLFEALINYTTKTGPDDATNGSATKVELKFVKVDSEETNGEDGYGKNAVDGNPDTIWHTQWQSNSPGLPHEIIIELDPPPVIKGFTYLPRQDESDHGTIKDFEFYVSDDGKNFGQPVKKGEFEPGKDEKIETFEPVKCRFVELKAISEINGLPWTSAAEIRLIPVGENIDLLTNPIHQASAHLETFQKTKTIDELEKAYRAVERILRPGTDGAVPVAVARREGAIMWLRLLAAIDENTDTNFCRPNNPYYSASIEVAPPGTNGMMYPSGVDPNDIKDPEVRKQYEAAIKENNEKMARANFHTQLRHLGTLSTIDMERFLRVNYTSSREDQSELQNLMKETRLSPIRIQRIESLFDK